MNAIPSRGLLAVATAVVVAHAANANEPAHSESSKASFQGLGDLPGGRTESCAIAVSADGRTATGWSAAESGSRAFRWSDGMIAELVADGGLVPLVGHAVSPDGTVVVGLAQIGSQTVGFYWRDGRAAALALPGGETEFMDAWGVSGDGRMVAGSTASSGRSDAVLWSGTNGARLADLPGGRPWSSATAISADGSIVVGRGESERGIEAVVWREGAPIGLGDLADGEWHSEPYAVSHDGAIIVGMCASTYGIEACQWRNGRLTALGSLSREHDFLSSARGMSRDAAVIVGSAIDDRDAPRAVVWDSINGIRDLSVLLAMEHGIDLKGWRLETAMGVSADGITIVGCGRNPRSEPEAWIVRFPPNWWHDLSVPYKPGASVSPAGADRDVHARLGRGTGVFDLCSDPHGVAIDAGGRTFIADSGCNAISVFDANRVLTGRWGSPGSGLRLDDPRDVAVTDDGAIFVADTGHHRVQVLGPDGRLRRSWGDRGSGPGSFNRPEGIAAHGGQVYVADSGNDRVQVFDHRGALLRLFGRYGHGVGELNGPTDLAVADDGRVLVADTGNHRICVFDPQGDWLGSWGDRGSTPGLFNRPTGIDCRGGQFYVVDQANHRIQVFGTDGGFRYAWGRQVFRPHEAGGRISYPARIALATDHSRAVICEPYEDRCQSFGMVETSAGATASYLDGKPLAGVAGTLHVGGDVLVTTDDAVGHVLVYRLTDAHPILVTKVGTAGHGVGQLSDPRGLWFDSVTSRLFIADTGNRRLQVFDLDRIGEPVKFVANSARLRKALELSSGGAGGSNTERFIRPGPLAASPEGLLAVVDETDNGVLLLGADHRVVRTLDAAPDLGVNLKRPVDVTFSVDGRRLFVLDADRPGVVAFHTDGTYTHAWGDRGSGAGEFLMPAGIEAGRDGFLYVSDRAAHRVQKFDEQGRFIAQWGKEGVGAGEFFKPRDVAQDSRGRVYVNDFGNRRIQVFAEDGRFLRAIGSPLAIHPTLVARQPQ